MLVRLSHGACESVNNARHGTDCFGQGGARGMIVDITRTVPYSNFQQRAFENRSSRVRRFSSCPFIGLSV